MNKLQNSEAIIHDSLKEAFKDALQSKFPRLRRKYHKGVGISLGRGPPKYKLYMVDTPTSRVLNQLRVKGKIKMIMNKIQMIENDYKDADKLMNLRLKTMGMMVEKLREAKEKVIV